MVLKSLTPRPTAVDTNQCLPVYDIGMGSVDEEISAMLQSSHASLSQASLAGVIAPVSSTSPDILPSFTSHAPPFQRGLPSANFGQGGRARTSSMPPTGLVDIPNVPAHVRLPPSRENPPQRWAPFNGDEKWVIDAKSEVLDIHTATPAFGAVYESSVPIVMPGVSSGLQRYHSAPSAFLQGLTEDAFSQVRNPLGNSNMGSLFSERGLTPITEQMDVERMGNGSSMHDFEQFLSPDSDFSRRAAMSALGKPEAHADAFTHLFPAAKTTGLVRQKSLPSATLTQPNMRRQSGTEENNSEESISGTSEDNSLVNGLKVSMYSQDDFFLRDTLTSWNTPTSPGPERGKRQRGLPGESETSSGSAEGPNTHRQNHQNGLIRHMSLPAATADGPMSLGVDDQYVQMRARAKRGCATHPRSIAERVRRTRISERMKKLQDLVPNMDKQTNTSDMLDETVQYVKSLQMKVKELTETIAQLKSAQQKSS